MTADLTLFMVTVELQSINVTMATYVHPVKKASVTNSFQDRFNVTWLPSKITLNIFDATTDDEEGFVCKVNVFDESAQIRGEGEFK